MARSRKDDSGCEQGLSQAQGVRRMLSTAEQTEASGGEGICPGGTTWEYVDLNPGGLAAQHSPHFFGKSRLWMGGGRL